MGEFYDNLEDARKRAKEKNRLKGKNVFMVIEFKKGYLVINVRELIWKEE